MTKQEFIRKISSRKFWALISALVSASMTGYASQSEIAQLIAVVGAIGACICYMFAEASIDKTTKINE
jgi:hypothetical protein